MEQAKLMMSKLSSATMTLRTKMAFNNHLRGMFVADAHHHKHLGGDTGYGSAMQVRRTVSGYASAGAAGVMIEDQVWPKRCGHTKDKSVVSREEAYARVQAAVDARNEGLDIWILGRTDSLIFGYDEALVRAQRFREIGADGIFVEALPDHRAMARFAGDMEGFPILANIIPGGRTENLPAAQLAEMGFAMVAYPMNLLGARLKAEREALEDLKKSFLTSNAPEPLPFTEVTSSVGFDEYYEGEKTYNQEAREE